MFRGPKKRGVLQLEGVLQLGGIRYIFITSIGSHGINNLWLIAHCIMTISLAVPGGAAGARPQKGADSFILTHKFYKIKLHRELTTPLRGWL